jgi:RNase_H superfamily
MSGPKILILDIETQPDTVWVWGVYEQNAISVKEHWQCLSFSARWFPKGKWITKGLCDYEGYKAGGDDRKLLQEVWNLLDEADIIVAHNGVDFDIKKLNARFIVHGMPPPSPFKVVDTKRATKRVAAFSSNKLDWLSQQLEIGKKLEHEGWPMWRGCMNGDMKMWAKMKHYNKHDVGLLTELYARLSPWLNQPNANMWSDLDGEPICVNPACKGKNLQRRGIARNKTRMYIRFQCKDCGAWGRAAHSEKKKAKIVPAAW